MYRGQPPVLEALWETDGLSHTELAVRLHVTQATMTRMIQRMEGAGWLVCAADELALLKPYLARIRDNLICAGE